MLTYFGFLQHVGAAASVGDLFVECEWVTAARVRHRTRLKPRIVSCTVEVFIVVPVFIAIVSHSTTFKLREQERRAG